MFIKSVCLPGIALIQRRGYGEGTVDHMVGNKESIVGAITGDKAQQTSGAYFDFCRVRRLSFIRRRQRAEREGPGSENEQVSL